MLLSLFRGQQAQQMVLQQQRPSISPSLPSSSVPVPPTGTSNPRSPRFPPQMTAPNSSPSLPPASNTTAPRNPPTPSASVRSEETEVICLDSDDSDNADNCDDGDDGDDEEEEEEEEELTGNTAGSGGCLAGAPLSSRSELTPFSSGGPLIGALLGTSPSPSVRLPVAVSPSVVSDSGNVPRTTLSNSSIDPRMAATLAKIFAAAKNTSAGGVGDELLVSGNRQDQQRPSSLLPPGGSGRTGDVSPLPTPLLPPPSSVPNLQLPHSVVASPSQTAPVAMQTLPSSQPSVTAVKHSQELIQKLRMETSSQPLPLLSGPVAVSPAQSAQQHGQPPRQPQAMSPPKCTPFPPPPLHRLTTAVPAQALQKTHSCVSSSQALLTASPLLLKSGGQPPPVSTSGQSTREPFQLSRVTVPITVCPSLPLHSPSGPQGAPRPQSVAAVSRPQTGDNVAPPILSPPPTNSHLGMAASPSPSTSSSISDDPSDYPLLSPVAAELYRRSQQSSEGEKLKRSASPALSSPTSSTTSFSPKSVRSPQLSVQPRTPGIPPSPSSSGAVPPRLFPARKAVPYLPHATTPGNHLSVPGRSEASLSHDLSPSPGSV